MVLTATQLEALRQHEYSGENLSLYEPYMQKFWTWLFKLVPLWMAPGIITLIGLATNVFCTLLLIIASPDAKAEVSYFNQLYNYMIRFNLVVVYPYVHPYNIYSICNNNSK